MNICTWVYLLSSCALLHRTCNISPGILNLWNAVTISGGFEAMRSLSEIVDASMLNLDYEIGRVDIV